MVDDERRADRDRIVEQAAERAVVLARADAAASSGACRATCKLVGASTARRQSACRCTLTGSASMAIGGACIWIQP